MMLHHVVITSLIQFILYLVQIINFVIDKSPPPPLHCSIITASSMLNGCCNTRGYISFHQLFALTYLTQISKNFIPLLYCKVLVHWSLLILFCFKFFLTAILPYKPVLRSLSCSKYFFTSFLQFCILSCLKNALKSFFLIDSCMY